MRVCIFIYVPLSAHTPKCIKNKVFEHAGYIVDFSSFCFVFQFWGFSSTPRVIVVWTLQLWYLVSPKKYLGMLHFFTFMKTLYFLHLLYSSWLSKIYCLHKLISFDLFNEKFKFLNHQGLWLFLNEPTKTPFSCIESVINTNRIFAFDLWCHPTCPWFCAVSPCALRRPWEYWASALFTHHTSLSWSMGNNLQVHWHLTALVCLRGRRWCCVPGITYILWRPGRLVHAVSCHPPLPPPPRLCFPMALARLHAWQTNRCYLPCISSSGPLSLSANSPLLAHRLQISPASLPLDKGQYQWQNIFYVWNVAHNKQSSIRFV